MNLKSSKKSPWVLGITLGLSSLLYSCITGGPLFREQLLESYGDKSHGNQPEDIIEVGANPRQANEESLVKGKQIFTDYCSPCHGNAGDGNGEEAPNLAIKPANLREIAGKKSDRYIFMQVSLGRDGMPMWSEELSTEDRWDIVNYVQSMK
jgi:mono/diheme cytochrome c family protein